MKKHIEVYINDELESLKKGYVYYKDAYNETQDSKAKETYAFYQGLYKGRAYELLEVYRINNKITIWEHKELYEKVFKWDAE